MVLVAAATQAGCRCGCDVIELEACTCADGTCQQGTARCGPFESGLPKCADLCKDHGGATSSTPTMCPADGG